MMNFSELVSETCKEVNRPDFTFESEGGSGDAVSAVAASIITLHLRQQYWRDIVTLQAVFDTEGYLQTVDLDMFPRFRQIKYVRKWDDSYLASQINPLTQPPANSLAAPLGFLEEISPAVIFDMYGYERTNVWYAAGSNLYIKSSSSFKKALIGYYSYPAMEPGPDGKYAGLNSWIASTYPYAVIYAAASKLFVTIGQQDTSRKYDRPSGPGDEGGLVQQQIIIIDRNNIVAGV